MILRQHSQLASLSGLRGLSNYRFNLCQHHPSVLLLWWQSQAGGLPRCSSSACFRHGTHCACI